MRKQSVHLDIALVLQIARTNPRGKTTVVVVVALRAKTNLRETTTVVEVVVLCAGTGNAATTAVVAPAANARDYRSNARMGSASAIPHATAKSAAWTVVTEPVVFVSAVRNVRMALVFSLLVMAKSAEMTAVAAVVGVATVEKAAPPAHADSLHAMGGCAGMTAAEEVVENARSIPTPFVPRPVPATAHQTV